MWVYVLRWWSLIIELIYLRSSHPIAGIMLPTDVYLSYNLFVVTNSLVIETFELALRVDDSADLPDRRPRHQSDVPSVPPSVLQSIPSVEARDPSLVCLLSKEPYVPPRVISLAAIDDLRKLGPPASVKNRQEIEITPESLRQFAMVVHQLQSHIRDVHMALHGLQNRLMLQDKEFQRQQEKYVEIVGKVERLSGHENVRLKQRFERTTSEQRRLLGRSDKLLQLFMDSSSPVLNEHEKRWFAELNRMKSDVLGEGEYDSASLKARTDAVGIELTLSMSMTDAVFSFRTSWSIICRACVSWESWRNSGDWKRRFIL